MLDISHQLVWAYIHKNTLHGLNQAKLNFIAILILLSNVIESFSGGNQLCTMHRGNAPELDVGVDIWHAFKQLVLMKMERLDITRNSLIIKVANVLECYCFRTIQ